MVCEIDDIVKDVRVCLDENDVQAALISNDSYTLQLDDIIRSKITDALDGILIAAPMELLGSGIDIPQDGTLTWAGVEDGSYVGKLACPKDFLKLIAIKCSDWDYEVREMISCTDDVYKMQKSRYAGVRGNPHRPIVADAMSANGRVLELYCSGTQSIEYAKYIGNYTTSTTEDHVSLPHDSLYRVLIYQIAGLVCVTLRDSEHAQTLFGLAEGLLHSASGDNQQ